MWHEARKQERRIRGLIVDYRRRAERRQDFYEKIQADPTQFIQVHGRRCKIHLDPAVAAAGDGAAIIVPWQGQQDNLIDRFDVRAHLDYIPPLPKLGTTDAGVEEAEMTQEERNFNYERYRILAQNDFLNVSEEKFLHQLYLEEQFGANAQLEAERNLGKKKQTKPTGATIGYSYEDVGDGGSAGLQPFGHLMGTHIGPAVSTGTSTSVDREGSDESDSDIDMDVSIDIAKLDTAQAHELNACGRNYGMKSNDFYSYLTKDADEADALRIAREEEQEKMLLSGRKSRRERRAQKERRIANRPFSPPSYAAKEEKGGKKENAEEESESRSPSPADGGTEKITYITSFGGEDELQPHSKITINLSKLGQTLGESCISASSGAGGASASVGGHVSYAQKVKENLDKLKLMNESAKRAARKSQRQNRSRSRSRSHSHGRRHSRRRSHYSKRSRSRSRQRRRRYSSRSRSSSYDRHHRLKSRRSRSRSHSRRRYKSSSYTSSSSSRASSHGRGRRRYRSRSTSVRQRDRSRADSAGISSINVRRKTPPVSVKEHKPQIFTTTVPVSNTTTTTTTTAALSTLTSVPVKPALNITVQAPPSTATQMISYPLPMRVMNLSTTSAIGTTPAPLITGTTLPVLPQVIEPPPPPLKRYYGRKRGDGSSSSSSSSSESSVTSDIDRKTKSLLDKDADDSDGNMDVDTTSERSNPLPSTSSSTTGNQTGKYSSAIEIKGGGQSLTIGSGCGSSSSSMRPNLRERLKRKMQNLLNRQYKADKRAEIEKSERERQLQQEREDEMRELALKLRRRQRELRHKYGTPSSGKNSGSEDDIEKTLVISKKLKRSKSRSHERRSAHVVTQSKQRHHSRRSGSHVAEQRRRSRGRRSKSRDRRRSRSRRRSNSRDGARGGVDRRRRSYSRRRSQSRRRRRSKSATRRRERDRSAGRTHPSRDSRHTERERERERTRPSEGTVKSFQGGNWTGRPKATDSSANSGGLNRGRVVISAPPKLKKLVDY